MGFGWVLMGFLELGFWRLRKFWGAMAWMDAMSVKAELGENELSYELYVPICFSGLECCR